MSQDAHTQLAQSNIFHNSWAWVWALPTADEGSNPYPSLENGPGGLEWVWVCLETVGLVLIMCTNPTGRAGVVPIFPCEWEPFHLYAGPRGHPRLWALQARVLMSSHAQDLIAPT